MKHSIQLHIAVLHAAYLATSAEDSMVQMFEHINIKNGHIFGSNGHLMFYSKLNDVSEDITISIPRMNVMHFMEKIKCFNLHLNATCKLEYDTEEKTGNLEIVGFHNAYEGFKLAGIPHVLNWKKAIPSPNDYMGKHVHFQGHYIKKLEEIAFIFGSVCFPLIKPTGETTAAIIELQSTEVDYDVHLLLMPYVVTTATNKYCIAIYDDMDDVATAVHAAPSAEIAIKAVKRLRADMSYGYQNPNFSLDNCVQVQKWQGTDIDHEKAMFYTEEWFSKPLRRYSDPIKAKDYMMVLNEPVECYINDKSTYAYTIEDIDLFFLENAIEPTVKC